MKIVRTAKRIIWYEAAGFITIIVIAWANEIGGLSRRVFGGFHTQNWQDALFLTLVTLMVAVPTMVFSRRISKRLLYLQGFLKVCAWCRKVGQGDEWVPFEEFAKKSLNTDTSHGICPDCRHHLKEDSRA